MWGTTCYNPGIVPKFSIVIPLHNEQESVTELYDRLKAVMEAAGKTFELVFVDDGSRDRTLPLLEEIAAIDSRVVVVQLRRNFGQTSALAAGFDHARASSSSPWTAICSTSRRTSPPSWKSLTRAMTLSAAGARCAWITW
jgi:GT2 family glycosyltransferase